MEEVDLPDEVEYEEPQKVYPVPDSINELLATKKQWAQSVIQQAQQNMSEADREWKRVFEMAKNDTGVPEDVEVNYNWEEQRFEVT